MQWILPRIASANIYIIGWGKTIDYRDRPTLRERRPIVADARDPVSPRKNARPIKTDRDKRPFGAAAHPPHYMLNLFIFGLVRFKIYFKD